MEPSSIITQVHRDEGNFNNNNEIDHLSTRLSKPRSVLRSLLCCFGLRRRHHQHHHEVRNGDLCSPQSPHQPSSSAAVTKHSASKLPIAAGTASNGVRGSCQVGDPADSNGRLTGSVNGSGVSVSGGGGGGSVASPPGCYLLPPVAHKDMGKICIVIDLDETLVHSSFKPISSADFIVPVEIDGAVHQVYVLKRPHVDKFLQCVGQLFECVLFTASLAKYADPVADLLDKQRVFGARLFRESCVYYRGNYVKDLQRLGRDLRRVIIVDNSPASYIFHPDNAVAVKSWFDDMSDTELLDCLPLLERLSRTVDVYAALANGVAATSLPPDDATIAPPVAPPVATN